MRKIAEPMRAPKTQRRNCTGRLAPRIVPACRFRRNIGPGEENRTRRHAIENISGHTAATSDLPSTKCNVSVHPPSEVAIFSIVPRPFGRSYRERTWLASDARGTIERHSPVWLLLDLEISFTEYSGPFPLKISSRPHPQSNKSFWAAKAADFRARVRGVWSVRRVVQKTTRVSRKIECFRRQHAGSLMSPWSSPINVPGKKPGSLPDVSANEAHKLLERSAVIQFASDCSTFATPYPCR